MGFAHIALCPFDGVRCGIITGCHFLVQSNDGVRLNIGGKQIFEDPDIHGDRFSPELYVNITDPGWYSIRVLYFERANSSTLELYWQEPEGDVVFVPTEAFGHIKK